MKKFVKHFVGKGKQVNDLKIIKVTMNIDGLKDYTYEFNGEKYITVEVAKMKNPDQFGREYTVYVSRQEEVTEDKPKDIFDEKKKNKKIKKNKKQKETIDELPQDPF